MSAALVALALVSIPAGVLAQATVATRDPHPDMCGSSSLGRGVDFLENGAVESAGVARIYLMGYSTP